MTSQLAGGQRVGDYEILSIAGSGGMGIVYRATQRSLERVVALKVIREEVASAPEYRERFLREARLAASVDHPHVVSVYGVGDEEGQLFLVMQWIDGQDLKRIIERVGRLAPASAVVIASQLAGALDAVHGAGGLVHRDVKPANVLVRQVGGSDHTYLTDFGVAKPSETTADQLTRTGWVVGTVGYLSPEQIRGQEPGPRSDLYALGCLFFETLTGKPPFRGENEMALRWAHANDPRPNASAAVPELGARYDRFLSVALAVDPDARFGSGREFASALASAHSGRDDTPVAASIIPQHAPTAVGPATPLGIPANTPPPVAPAYPGYGYATPPPAPAQHSRSGNPVALILLGLVALAGIAVGALAAAGVFSHNPTTQTITSSSSIQTTPATGSTSANAATGPSAGNLSPATSSPTSTGTIPAATTPDPNGTDPRGFNVGPGCSDDPASALPGCSDSPSAPNGDPVGPCANGITVDRQTTTCGLAQNVQSSYNSDGPVTATSPKTGQAYTFTCQTGGSGTTGYTICQSQAGASTLYLRWHR